MIAEGYTGRKGKGGFYRLNRAGGGKVKEAIDLVSGSYRPDTNRLPELAAPRRICAGSGSAGRIGRYAWRVLGQTSPTRRAGAGGRGRHRCDRRGHAPGLQLAMGTFRTHRPAGRDWFADKLRGTGIAGTGAAARGRGQTFYRLEDGRRQFLGSDGAYHDLRRPDGVLMLEDVKRVSQPVLSNGSAAVWDIGDGVLCFEFTSKSNSLDDQIIGLLGKTIALVQQKYKALVIYNEGRNFSVGANLGLAMFAANIAAWGEIEKLIAAGQQAYKALKYAPFPVVGAPAGMALGGGCEILLHSDAVQAHAESYIGLVECGVGLLPGWGGCKEMLARWSRRAAAAARADARALQGVRNRSARRPCRNRPRRRRNCCSCGPTTASP